MIITIDTDELSKDIIRKVQIGHCNASEVVSEEAKQEARDMAKDYDRIIDILAVTISCITEYADIVIEEADGPDSMRDPESLAESIEQDALDALDELNKD